MADSIKIGNLDISAFKVGSSDCKIYLGDTLLYPKTPNYFRFVAIEDGQFKLSGNTVEYSLDNGSTWTSLASDTYSPTVSSGTFVKAPNMSSWSRGRNGIPTNWTVENYCYSVNFYGIDANGNDVTIDNGTSTLVQTDFKSLYPVEGEVGTVTTTIGEYCFSGVSSTLSALTICNTVTTIKHEAFMETSLLTTLTIPASVTQIDFWAFTRCTALQEVIFEGTTPPRFTNLYSGVFHDYCPPVIYVPDEAVSTYRAIGGSVWTNRTWSSNIIQPISNRQS